MSSETRVCHFLMAAGILRVAWGTERDEFIKTEFWFARNTRILIVMRVGLASQ